MRSFPVHEAKAKLSAVLRLVETGEDVVITRAGEPVARLTAINARPKTPEQLGFGSMRGQITLAEDFDAPMTEDELSQWYDGPIFPPDER
ncbi:MAG: type II toxin-antitoxin system prevent-host-death family antitoxin [Solirubrobacteraceae bacterium]